MHSYYVKKYNYESNDFPNAARIFQECNIFTTLSGATKKTGSVHN